MKTKVCRVCKDEMSIECFREYESHGNIKRRHVCKFCQNRRQALLPKKPKTAQQIQKYNLKFVHHMTPEEYKEKHDEQKGLCAICQRPETITHKGKLLRLAVDHDHQTKCNRGLLCADCNRALGMLQDNILVLEAAIAYLRLYA